MFSYISRVFCHSSYCPIFLSYYYPPHLPNFEEQGARAFFALSHSQARSYKKKRGSAKKKKREKSESAERRKKKKARIRAF
jgi:hypothetical protein